MQSIGRWRRGPPAGGRGAVGTTPRSVPQRRARGVGRRTAAGISLEAPDAGPLLGQLVISADAAPAGAPAPRAARARARPARHARHLASRGLHDRVQSKRTDAHAASATSGDTPARLWRECCREERLRCPHRRPTPASPRCLNRWRRETVDRLGAAANDPTGSPHQEHA